MLDSIVGTAESVAREWRAEADRRRGYSAVDPVADTLAYCAGELVARLHAVSVIETDGVTVDAFAERHGVTAQTVRQWCRRAMVPARLTSHGWIIRADAARPGTTAAHGTHQVAHARKSA